MDTFMCLAKACLATLTVFGQDDPNIPFLFYLFSTKKLSSRWKVFSVSKAFSNKDNKKLQKILFNAFISHKPRTDLYSIHWWYCPTEKRNTSCHTHMITNAFHFENHVLKFILIFFYIWYNYTDLTNFLAKV